MHEGKKKFRSRNLFIVALLLFVMSGGLLYYSSTNEATVKNYEADVASASSLESQIASLTQENERLTSTIEQNGKELVSFTDDKNKYTTLASDLSKTYNVKLNKLTVSDIWQDGQMAVMTTNVELSGTYDNVRKFVDEYCSNEYTNRINVVSLRQDEDYVWVSRDIDGELILDWFDLSEEQSYYDKFVQEKEAERQALANAAGVKLESTTAEERDPISLEVLWRDVPIKAYLEIDFLGRN